MSSALLFMLLLSGLGIGGNMFSDALPICIFGACGSCPFGWTLYDRHCYLFRNTQTTWANAEDFCNLFGGHLTSIQGPEQYSFLRGLTLTSSGVYVRTWLGATNAVDEGLWMWADGSPFTFTNWGPGEPNNQGGNEHCMEMNLNGQDYVNDENCDTKNAFICVKNDP